MDKKTVIKLLSQEIKWCKKNPSGKSKTWEKGFIKGLEQASSLIKKIK